jgi:hypothetical protein
VVDARAKQQGKTRHHTRLVDLEAVGEVKFIGIGSTIQAMTLKGTEDHG